MAVADGVRTRQLTVLGEFKPFGLIAEALDGKLPAKKYDYFLFDPAVSRGREDGDEEDNSDVSCSGDHEIFFSGSRLIWSSGSRVHKQFSCSNPILMVCWCRMYTISEAFLCVLQSDTLSIFNASGEMVSIPLPCAVASIWPLPFGLLLEKAADGNEPVYFPSNSSNSLLNERELSRCHRGHGSSRYTFNIHMSNEHSGKDTYSINSSHFILKHPFEEPQMILVEEGGKLGPIKEFDEKTIWTSETIPLLASYNKGKMKHSIWMVEIVNSDLEAETGSGKTVNGQFSKQFSFRRIWQGTCSQSAANKVFLAIDDDGIPIICFLLEDQKFLFSVRLQINQENDVLFDVKPHLTWSIPAVDAAPVIVTRPRIKVGILSFIDIVVLTSENDLLLYTGKQCLCRFVLPNGLEKCQFSRCTQSTDIPHKVHDQRIVGIVDAVKGRINIVANSGKIFRCLLTKNPSSALVSDCITALSEALHLSSFNCFYVYLWGESCSNYLCNAATSVDSEWECFANAVLKICEEHKPIGSHHSDSFSETSWNFLLNSKFHFNYSKHPLIPCISVQKVFSDGMKHSIADAYDGKIWNKAFTSQFLTDMLDTLHALYESLKLNTLRKRDLKLLVTLLCRIATSLGETSYIDHYIRDFPNHSLYFGNLSSTIVPRSPPCLFQWLENHLKYGIQFTDVDKLPPLIYKASSSAVKWARKIVSFYSLLLGAKRSGKQLSSGVYCDIAKGSASTREECTILAMVAENFGLQQLDLLPAGVSLPLRHALDKCRESPPTDWPTAAYVLVGREDLALVHLHPSTKSRKRDTQSFARMICISPPYQLHLQSVTVHSSISDLTRLDTAKVEDSDSLRSTVGDGMDHIFNSTTQLRYGRDLRLNEVRRLLSSVRPVSVQTSGGPSASDQDAQQHQLWNLAQRTTALPLGRGAFTLATSYTLLTEALHVPKLNLSGRLPAQQNATVNLDPNVRNVSELRTWPEFHNGVAAGLSLAPFEGKMSRTWILYNKPEEPNVTHAGLLLAFGLHGHLRVLTIADLYRCLSQEHDITTVGLLLGAAASHRGTMDPAISKMLFLHIPSRHLSTFPEIEIPTILQSASLMAVGLLYEGSGHPLTMNILMAEIGRISADDNVLEREGYAVAAGSALGLVGLGRGQDAFGVTDTFVDRLFQYVCGKELHSDGSSKMRLSTDEENHNIGQIIDGTQINVDVTATGATIALALIFLKTESEVIFRRFSIPKTHFELQYVRPDFIMLRIIAKNLIMWSRIWPSRDWVEGQIPEFVKTKISGITDDGSDCDDIDADALVKAYVNIVTGACISIGLKYAGTRNAEAHELLYGYSVYFLNEIKPICGASYRTFPSGLLQFVDRGTLETCLHLIVLSLSVVMAGTGHLKIFRLLRYLRNRSSIEGQINYGFQMAVSLAIGFLFLGGGMQTFSTGNSAIAALLITLYPRFPTGPNDNRCHLQAFRHFFVIAAESRWLQTVDVDTGLPVYAPLEVTISETAHYAESIFYEITPCILPERAILKTIRICGPRYWSHVIQLVPEDKPWWRSGDRNNPFNGGFIYIKRKVGSCSYVDDPVGCQSLFSRMMHKVSEASLLECSTRSNTGNAESALSKVDQLISAFSADPSLISFAQLCCDSSWNSRSDADFRDFCLEVLFECISRERPALLQVYISLYTNIRSMWEHVHSAHVGYYDSLSLLSLKLAMAYDEAVTKGNLVCTKNECIIQSTFVESLRKRVEEILGFSQRVKVDLYNYLQSGKWPDDGDEMGAALLSWYLQWHRIPHFHVLKSALKKIKDKNVASSSIPLLHLLLPRTKIHAIIEIDRLKCSFSNE